MLVGESGCGKTSIVLDKLRGVWNNDVSGIKATKHSAKLDSFSISDLKRI